MATPVIDFTHLSTEQRIELAEQLWESLEPRSIQPSARDTELLRNRRTELERDGQLGDAWQQTVQELRARSA